MRYGIEGVRRFGAARAAGYRAGDLTYVFNICNGFDRQLRDAGHTRAFYWANDACWETDLRSSDLGGADGNWSDDVDVFFILTHGRMNNGVASLLYNTKADSWEARSDMWRLGDRFIEWLFIYGCHTIDIEDPTSHWDVFQRLHHFCGSWGDMWDGITTDEVGEDVADNLTDGYSVVGSWIDGVSDWWVNNHAAVVASERQSTWNGGNIDWSNTTMNRDHVWGHGVVVGDVRPRDKYWLSWVFVLPLDIRVSGGGWRVLNHV
ncbi:DUF6345 domain-containing protein [Nonomuraea roseola]|uniref:DUF6345 domain-containing protein n=1 Tax=Nonomuraea roseola TaxID=46179 RepID=A0ABV5QDS4_9ACTN